MEIKYDVFISYSRKDYVDKDGKVIPGNVVSRVRKMIEEAGYTDWFDENIHYADDWMESIVEGIENSRIFVFLASKNANKSIHTRREISIADQQNKTIIPFRIDDSDYDKAVNYVISNLQYIAYYKNKEESFSELLDGIKTQLENIYKIEAELKEKEVQEQLFADIKNTADELKIEEEKIILERKNLLLKSRGLNDENIREIAIKSINDSSPIRNEMLQYVKESQEIVANLKEEMRSLLEQKKKVSKEKDEIQNHLDKSERKMHDLESQHTMFQEENERLRKENEFTKGELHRIQNAMKETAYHKERTDENRHPWWMLVLIFLSGLFIGCFLLYAISHRNVSNNRTANTLCADSLASKNTEVKEDSAKRYVEDSMVVFKFGKAKYTGSLDEEGLPHGKGMAVSDNEVFRGTFKHGKIDSGRITFKNGESFEGIFKDNEVLKGIWYNTDKTIKDTVGL